MKPTMMRPDAIHPDAIKPDAVKRTWITLGVILSAALWTMSGLKDAQAQTTPSPLLEPMELVFALGETRRFDATGIERLSMEDAIFAVNASKDGSTLTLHASAVGLTTFQITSRGQTSLRYVRVAPATPAAAVEAALKSHGAALRGACLKGPGPDKLPLRVTVGAKGEPLEVQVDEPGAWSAKTLSCVQAAVLGWRFQVPERAMTSVALITVER